MGRNVARQIQPAVRRQTTGEADASASNERRDTERITARTVAKAKRRLRTKPEKRPARAKGGAEEKHTEAAVPFEQIVVGEREGEPNYKKPGQPSNQDENRNTNAGDDAPSEHPPPVADARAVQDPRDAQAQAQGEAPPFVPEPLPRGAHRPYVPRLEEVLFGLDGICVYDAQIQAQVDDIGRLIMVLRHKEAEVAQKVRDVQRTRIVVEKLYTSRVKLDPSLIGQGDSEGEGESGGEEREEERPEGGADDHDQPPQVARSKAVTNGKRRAVDPTAGPPEVEETRPRAKRVRSQ